MSTSYITVYNVDNIFIDNTMYIVINMYRNAMCFYFLHSSTHYLQYV